VREERETHTHAERERREREERKTKEKNRDGLTTEGTLEWYLEEVFCIQLIN